MSTRHLTALAALLLAGAGLLVAGCGGSDTSSSTGSARGGQNASKEAEGSECDPNYTGACLDPYASDYDCEGGSGNGPYYTGEVIVVGEDHYGLDADGDGIGCEGP